MGTSCDAIPFNHVCGIYKITNMINNKIYIGRSTDIHRRWLEHLRSAQPDKYVVKSLRDSNAAIHLAMKKYGIKNFKLELIEKCKIIELDEKEKYWINKLQSNQQNIGYNETPGGQKNFALKGEKHSQAKLTQEQVDEIIKELQSSKVFTTKELAKKYNISPSNISQINNGHNWKKENLKYPIRIMSVGSVGTKNPRAILTEEEVMTIRIKQSQGYTYKDMPEDIKNKVSRANIECIMKGRSYKSLPIWDKKNQKWIEPCIDYSQS